MKSKKSGLHISGIESVNVHDAIKVGTSDRDKYIDNYIETFENLGKEDIHLVCYNFMPVFDWTKVSLQENVPTVQPCLHTIKMILIKSFPRRCLNLFQRI